jgi:uncharacterized RDD family membrane protein YckC
MEALAQAPDQPALITSDAWDTLPHPWRRYGARIIDVQLFGGAILFVVAALIGLFASDAVFLWVAEEARWKSMLIYGPLSWILTGIAVAPLLAWKGITPGKLLFGLRVIAADGRPLGLGRALRREAMLLVWGIGFALPLLNLAAGISSFQQVEGGAPARWDAHTALTVEARRVAGWQLAGVILGTILVVVSLAWSLVERLAVTLAS